jgi:dipeptidyl aminopeptidase/acylaminoacyl peptidase
MNRAGVCWRRFLWGVALFVSILRPAVAQPQAPIPALAFFSPAKMQGARLSPGGRWLAAITSVPGRRVGFLMIDLDGKEPSRFVETSDKDDVVWFRWVDDEGLVFSVNDPQDRSVWGLGRGLMSMRRDGTESRMLIAREYEPEDPLRKRRYLDWAHRFLSLGAPGSREVVVGEPRYDVRHEFSHTILKAVNITSGATRTMPDLAALRASDWLFDVQGRPRVARQSVEGDVVTWWADDKGVWKELVKAPRFQAPYEPAYVDGNDGLVVRTAAADGSLVLRRFDFSTGKPVSEAIVSTPGFSGGLSPVRLPGSGTVVGLNLTVDATTTVWFSPEMRQLQDKVNAKFPGRVNVLHCQPCDNPRAVVVHTFSDVDPGSWVLYQPKDDKWQLIGQARPDIDPRRMARMSLHRTAARDGREIPVWITRPPGDGPRPAVVLVHGGPNVRGSYWGWDASAQFLASRGYVVIEPEFRGSVGYGFEHFKAGWKQWGRAMQDDVTDALRFAAAKGWADAARACIVGSSYGGYAALWGLAKDPDLYRCGIAHVAVTDPRHMFDFHWNDISSDAKQYSLSVLLGDPKADAEMLAAVSPLEHAQRIKAPVLLVHGGRDRRVPIDNGERMRDALRRHDKVVDWVVYPEEGHGFQFLENELDYWRRVEGFLARHLKP